MIISTICLIFSFLFQGFISNHLKYSLTDPSILSCVYLLVTLIVILPYFENEKKYIKLLVIFGLLMDIVYTNTFILNTLIFLVIYFVCKFINYFLPHNIFTINLLNIVSMIVYHLLTFLILLIIGYDKYSFLLLLKIISHSLIMTIVYGNIMYLIVSSLMNQFQIKEIK